MTGRRARAKVKANATAKIKVKAGPGWRWDAHDWGVGVVFALYAVGFGDKTGCGSGCGFGRAGDGRAGWVGAGLGEAIGAGSAAVAG